METYIFTFQQTPIHSYAQNHYYIQHAFKHIDIHSNRQKFIQTYIQAFLIVSPIDSSPLQVFIEKLTPQQTNRPTTDECDADYETKFKSSGIEKLITTNNFGTNIECVAERERERSTPLLTMRELVVQR